MSSGSHEDLDHAVDVLEKAVAEPTRRSRELPLHLSRLGSLLHARYRSKGEIGDLERAVNAWREAARITASDAPELPRRLSNLGNGLHMLFSLSDHPSHLDSAIEALERAVETSTADSSDLLDFLSLLGFSRYQRFERAGDVQDLDRAIEVLEDAAARAAPGSPERFADLGREAACRYARNAVRGNPDDLDRSIALFEQCVAEAPLESTDRHVWLVKLARALRQRDDQGGPHTDLDRAIDALEFAVGLATQAADQVFRSYLYELGYALHLRFSRWRDPADLDCAIEAWEHTAAQSAPSEERAEYFSALGFGLRERFAHSDDPADSDAAVRALERALADSPSEPAVLSRHIANLAGGLYGRYRRSAAAADLDRAIEQLDQAVDTAPPGSAERLRYLGQLRTVLRERYDARREAADLDRGIDVLKSVVAVLPDDSTDLPERLYGLGADLLERHAAAGRLDDRAAALAALERCVATTPPGSPDLPSCLNALAACLARPAADRSTDQLQRAIELWREVVAGAPAGEPMLYRYLTNLGSGLHIRFSYSGVLDDLESAVEAFQEAVGASPDEPVERAQCLHNYGLGLHEAYGFTHSREHLDAAIDAFEEAAALAPAGSATPTIQDGLGSCLRERYAIDRARDDIDNAVAAHERALASVRAGSPAASAYLNNLGAALLWRYEGIGDASDLERALETFDTALAATPAESPERPGALWNLASALRHRHHRTGTQSDRARAIDAYREACTTGLALALVPTLPAAEQWGDWATERRAWTEAATAYGYGQAAMERLFRTQLARRTKEIWLQRAEGIAARAAYALARSGDGPAAAAAVERGRALLLSETLERERGDLDDLTEAGHADLAERYRRAAGAWNALGGPEPAGELSILSSDERSIQQRIAAAELEAAIAAIRAVEDYERFLDPPTFQTVAAAATHAPLVYLVATQAGGLSLVVGSQSDTPVNSVWLPELTHAAVGSRFERYFSAYGRRQEDPGAWWAALEDTTAWLWEAAMGPVLAALGPARRAVLVPAGLLALLPLHAAWTDDNSVTSGRRYALDEALITYAPNARALDKARRIAERVAPDGLLAVEEPRPVQAPPLPHARREVQSPLARFPRRRHLPHEAATRSAVLAALAEYPVLHFACHGEATVADPLESALLMAGDELLTLRDVMDQRLSGARLAVLSACETAVPGTLLPDEVVSLPSGLLEAGVAGVVGSLWSVVDVSTMALFARFYELWLDGDGVEPAEALRRAQQWLRDTPNAAKREHFPDVPELADTGVPPKARTMWEGAHAHEHPRYWAAFAYVGA